MRDRLAEILRTLAERGHYLRRALRIIWTAAGAWTLAWLGLLIVQGLLPGATVYLTKWVVDAFAAAVGAGLTWETTRPVLLPAVLMGLVLVARQVLQSVLNWANTAQSEYIKDHIKALVHEKAAEVDLAFYEIPDASDRLSRANGQAGDRSLSLLQNVGGIFQNVITLVAIAGLLVPYGGWLPLILLISALPALWVVLRHNMLHHAWWERTTETRRWAQYYDRLQTLPYAAAEIRALGLSDRLQSAYNSLRTTLRKGRLHLLRDKSLAQFGAGVSALVVMTAAIGWIALQAVRGLATLGDVALFYQAFNQGQSVMRSMLSSAGNLYTDTQFLEHLFAFLDEKPDITSPPDPIPVSDGVRESVTFEEVRFQYPNSSTWALDGFSLTIPAGQTVAVVGPNGAGKSTLVKLLCRFYDPASGRVTIDGVDIRDIDLKAHRRRITAMFQYPLRFIAPVAENIQIGDVYTSPDPERLRRAAHGGGATEIIERLPNGYETLLGKHFEGGAELSGGEWQRITLSRAFYREAPLVVLDEPTSFMDSWAESEWLDRFSSLVADQTAIIITHRFTTAMRADQIHVMKDGRVVESGTHAALMERDGYYAASWNAQIRAGATEDVMERRK